MYRPLLNVSVAVACLLACVTNTRSQVGTESSWTECIYAGKVSYFRPETEICCNGNIFRKSEFVTENCCGNRPYDSATGKCCAGTTVYNSDTHFCCGGEVYPHDDKHFTCCERGTRLINTTSHTCCSERTVEGTGKCCGNKAVYDPSTEHCCTGREETGHVQHMGREAVTSGKLACCNGETFDTRRDRLCCQGNLVQRQTPFTQCCGPETFDSSTEVCCESSQEHKISPLVKGRSECCGLVPYNKDNDQCCSLSVTWNIGDGLCCGYKAYNPLRSSCCQFSVSSIPQIPGVQGCCSGQSYLTTTHICCEGSLHVQESGKVCCGTDLYDPSVSLCCNNQVVDKVSPTSQCCGRNATFDTERQTCCGGLVADVVNGSCCRIGRNILQAYDPRLEQCCGNYIGRVHDINANCCGRHVLLEGQLCNQCRMRPIDKDDSDDNRVCCFQRAARTYNSQREICRRDTGGNIRIYVKKIPHDGEDRCRGKLYPLNTKMCCGGSVQDREYYTDRMYTRKCCGEEAYVPEWHTCQNNLVVEGIPDQFAGTCRGTVFNNATHACDSSSGHIRPKHEIKQGLEACDNLKAEGGYYPYNPTKKQCCGGTLIGQDETCCNDQRFETPGTRLYEGECCNQIGFNLKTHICCDGVLHPNTEEGQECCGPHTFNPFIPSNSMCCNDTLLSTAQGQTKCTDGVAHRPTDTVCNGKVYEVENGECCGALLMDSNIHICCQGQYLYDIADQGDTCCGKVAYHSTDDSRKCCGNSLFPNAQNVVCCGNQVMDSFKEVCHAVNDVSYVFPRGENVYFCSQGMYDPKRQTCCEGLLYDFVGVCCGSEVISPVEDGIICCGGVKKHHDFGDNALCCGGQVWDAKRYTCCGDLQALPINYHLKTCCNGVVISGDRCGSSRHTPRPPSNLGPSMCGDQTYNASLMACCAGQLYNPKHVVCCGGATKNASTFGCCDGRPYQLTKQTCCGTQLKNVKNGACCGPDTPYNQDRYLCCADNTLRRKKKGRTECCGGYAINPITDMCCEGTVTRGMANGTCCGNRAFNHSDKMCCPNTGELYKRRPGLEDILQSCCPLGWEYDIQAGICIQPAYGEEKDK